jgi:hypothetical protein
MRCSFWLSDWVCARQGERVFGQPACVAQLPGVLDSRTRPATAITEPRVRRAPRSFLLILLLGSPGLIIDGMRSVVVAALTKLARLLTCIQIGWQLGRRRQPRPFIIAFLQGCDLQFRPRDSRRML